MSDARLNPADAPDCKRLDDQLSDMFIQKVVAASESARGVKAADLTETQKFAVAMAAGVPTLPALGDDHAMTLSTVPCKIEDDGEGGYVVGWQDDYKRLVMTIVKFK